VDVQDARKQDVTNGAAVDQSQTYLKHRLRKVELQLASFQASSNYRGIAQPGDPAPWQPEPDITGNHQDVLDRTVDSLVKAAGTLQDSNTTLVQVFAVLEEIGELLHGACLQEDSLFWYEQAVEFARLLVQETETNFARAQLARLLRSKCGVLRSLEQDEAALSSAKEALVLVSELFIDKPAIYRADLARCLRLVSSVEAALGHHEAALAISLRSVELARQLAGDGAAGAQNHLRDVLNSLSRRQAACGEPRAALLTMEEVVASIRIDFQRDPAQHQLELAIYLKNLARRQHDQFEYEAALASMRESIDLYRPLYQARPDFHRSDFIPSLVVLSAVLRMTENDSAALEAASEAAALCRLQYTRSPSQSVSDSAQAALEMSDCQFVLGWSAAEVLKTAHEAIALCRSAARERPELYAADLPGFLRRLAAFQADFGQLDAALTTVQEALDLWPSYIGRRLSGSFAALLHIAASIYGSLGQEAQARSAREECSAMMGAQHVAYAAVVGEIRRRERRALSLGQDAEADAARAEREALEEEHRARKVVHAP
jgi:tetratricopeptide (TPR) repeat protein